MFRQIVQSLATSATPLAPQNAAEKSLTALSAGATKTSAATGADSVPPLRADSKTACVGRLWCASFRKAGILCSPATEGGPIPLNSQGDREQTDSNFF